MNCPWQKPSTSAPFIVLSDAEMDLARNSKACAILAAQGTELTDQLYLSPSSW